MRAITKTLSVLVLVAAASSTYAIQVSVQSSSSAVSALGFSANGKSHGGAGRSYTNSNMPVGTYTFGVRVNGLFGTDVACATSNGRKTFTLKSDTSAVLNYDGNRCIMRLHTSQ